MRCCITGGGGYFGQHIAREMQKEGYHTVLLDLVFTEVQREAFRLDETKTTRIQGSMLDDKILEGALKDCDVCIHIAAYGMAGAAGLDSDQTFRVNVHGTLLLLSVCNRARVPRVVFASSVGVIFTDRELNMATEDQPRPEEYYSVYSETKADAEVVMLKSNKPGFNTIALRFRGIFGPGEPRATDRAAEAIARGLYIAKIEKSSPVLTQYSGVDNSARAVFLAVKALTEKPNVVGGQVYTIVDGGKPVDSFGFWNPLIEALGRHPPSISIPYSIAHFFIHLWEILYIVVKYVPPPVMNRLELNLIAITNTYSIERAKRDLGYNPTNNHDLTEICKFYKNKYAKHPVSQFDLPLFLVVLFVFSLFLLFFLLPFIL